MEVLVLVLLVVAALFALMKVRGERWPQEELENPSEFLEYRRPKEFRNGGRRRCLPAVYHKDGRVKCYLHGGGHN